MTIPREEIFGPVLALIRAESTDQAIRIANDTEHGLSPSGRSTWPPSSRPARFIVGWDLPRLRNCGSPARWRTGTLFLRSPHTITTAYDI
jgi:hypothetical protein